MSSSISGDYISGISSSSGIFADARPYSPDSETQRSQGRAVIVDVASSFVEQQEETKPAQSTATSWEKRFGIKAGTYTLKNGNRQVVTTDGSHMELLEYEGNRLVRKETGEIDGNVVTRDVETYDQAGRVAHSAHVTLTTYEGGTKDEYAVMRREMSWFEGDNLVRELQDSMQVTAKSIKLNPYSIESPDAGSSTAQLLASLTKDLVSTKYSAFIQNYKNGVLTEDASLKQGNETTLLVNRNDVVFSGMEANSAEEENKNSTLSVNINTYDMDGKLLRQAQFTDKLEKGSKHEQSSTVSWYNDGELIKRSHGTFSSKATAGAPLPDRTNVFNLLSISEKTYSQENPLSSTQLLDRLSSTATDQGNLFAEPTGESMNAQDYSSVKNITDSNFSKRPFEMSYETETYRDGELVSRQRDELRLRETRRITTSSFRKGRGLTENEDRRLLFSSSHEAESFQDGKTTAHSKLDMTETKQLDDDDLAVVNTSYRAQSGVGMERREMSGVLLGDLDEHDNQFSRAGEQLGADVELTLDTFADSVTALKSGYDPDRQRELRMLYANAETGPTA